MMVEMCQMAVRWCMKVYDGRNVSDGCQMVYDGVTMKVHDGASVSDGCQMVYDGVGRLNREGLSLLYIKFLCAQANDWLGYVSSGKQTVIKSR